MLCCRGAGTAGASLPGAIGRARHPVVLRDGPCLPDRRPGRDASWECDWHGVRADARIKPPIRPEGITDIETAIFSNGLDAWIHSLLGSGARSADE